MKKSIINFTTARVSGFSDGIIALVLSLMVLNIELPPLVENPTSHEIHGHFIKLLPTIGVYFISFVSIGIFWVNHHNFFYLFKHINYVVLWLNLGLLFALTLVPLPTGFLADYPLSPDATGVYAFNLFFCNTYFGLIVWYSYKKKLLQDNIDDKSIKTILRMVFVACLLWVLAIFIGFVHVGLSYTVMGIIALIFIKPKDVNYIQDKA